MTERKPETPKKRKLKIMWASDAIFSISGYGQQTQEILPRMVKDGHEVAQTCLWGLEGAVIGINGITLYPKIGMVWGEDAIIEHTRDYNPDCVMTLKDVWVWNPENIKQFKNWIAIVPVDHEPIPPAVRDRLRLAYRIVAISKFGHEELKRNGLNSTYIPHSVDTKIFYPKDKKEIRKKVGIPEDKFIFGMVAANKDNPPRKSFQEVMDAFKIFVQKHDNAALYFHAKLNEQGGFPVIDYAKHIGIDKYIYHTQPYELLFRTDKEKMCSILNVFDVLLCPSTNGGFEIPVIEAQACGIPVITSEYTAMRDNILPGITGEFVKTLYERYSPLCSYVSVPDPASILEKMELLYNSDLKAKKKQCREFIKANYDSDYVYNKYWRSFISKLENELIPVDNPKQ